MASSAISIDTIRQSIGGFGVTAPDPGDGGEEGGTTECEVKRDNDNNIQIGGDTLMSLINGNENTAVGVGTLPHMTSGSGNVCVGSGAGSDLNGGYNNVMIGSNSGGGAVSATNNIAIGHNTTFGNDDTGQIVIGTHAEGRGAHTVQLGRNDVETRLFCGDKEVAFQNDMSPLVFNPVTLPKMFDDVEVIKQALHVIRDVLADQGYISSSDIHIPE